jgi:hypothetical protein
MSSFRCRFCDILITFQDSWLRDGEAWAFHDSADVALKNLSSWVDPFSGRGSSVSNEPYFDTDLYTIHTLRLTSTIHLHLDSMSLKISNVASELLGLINFLNPGDYCYLDPILAVCFYCLLFYYWLGLVADYIFFVVVVDLLVLCYCQLSPYDEHYSYYKWQRGFNGALCQRLPPSGCR